MVDVKYCPVDLLFKCNDSNPFRIVNSAFLLLQSGEIIVFAGEINPFSLGQSPFLLGKSPFLLGKSAFLLGKISISRLVFPPSFASRRCVPEVQKASSLRAEAEALERQAKAKDSHWADGGGATNPIPL